MTGSGARLDRRRAIALGGGAAGGLLAAAGVANAALVRPSGIAIPPSGRDLPAPGLELAAATPDATSLPVSQIEHIIQGPGMVSGPVLTVSLGRSDIGQVRTPLGVTLDASFELTSDLSFQAIGKGKAILNGCATLKPREVNPFIDAVIRNGLVFQALHQHYIEEDPQTWHVHFRGVDDPLRLARASHDAIRTATSTPLPQKAGGTSTPLNADRLGRILGGSASVSDGVVTVDVPRKETIRLGGVVIDPDLNVATSVSFKPLNGDRKAAAAPDFSLIASEVNPVTQLMRRQDWFVGCLYNQETDEQPQLYFSHMLKVGDPYELAREIREGLDLTNSDFTA